MKREPALLYSLAGAIFAVLAAYGLIGEDKISLWESLIFAAIAVLQGYFTRGDVMPMTTINEAGMTAADVKKMAADPNVRAVDEDDILPPPADYTV